MQTFQPSASYCTQDATSGEGFYYTPNDLGNTSSDVMSGLREQVFRDRINFLENVVNKLQVKVDELTGKPEDVEFFQITDVTVDEAKEKILTLLKKKKVPLYISDIIEESHMDPETVYIAYEQLVSDGKIKKS